MTESKNEIVYSDKWVKVFQTLNESQKRWFAAQKALEIGRGGVQKIHSISGLSRTTILRGMKELDGELEIASMNRVRHLGGGRKRKEISPESPIQKDLERILDTSTAGDPMNPLKWTLKSTRALANELVKIGHSVSPMTVYRLLQKLGYSLRANMKTIEPGSDHPDRDQQFLHINDAVKRFLESRDPVISVDAKKKERVGLFKNNGRKWEKGEKKTNVNAYDFLSLGKGIAIPYGALDSQRNEGMVNVGMTHDTAEFAVASIMQWWKKFGKKHYSHADGVLICCDGGGSNGSRSRSWKYHLQQFSDKIGKKVSVCHYPPGTSKWNKIEHRMFSFISMNWRGEPLVNYETVVNLIEGTTNKKGLKIKASLDHNKYEVGIKISDKAMKSLQISPDQNFPKWNYTISPRAKMLKIGEENSQ